MKIYGLIIVLGMIFYFIFIIWFAWTKYFSDKDEIVEFPLKVDNWIKAEADYISFEKPDLKSNYVLIDIDEIDFGY